MTHEFAVRDRVEVISRDENGNPGPYNGCVGWITAIFTHEGERSARVYFSQGIQKKVTLSQLKPAPRPRFERSTDSQTSPAPPLPEWASPTAIMVQGSHLRPGDFVYFSKVANPRHLKSRLDDRTWEGDTLYISWGLERRIPGSIWIVSERWYVVNRKQRSTTTR